MDVVPGQERVSSETGVQQTLRFLLLGKYFLLQPGDSSPGFAALGTRLREQTRWALSGGWTSYHTLCGPINALQSVGAGCQSSLYSACAQPRDKPVGRSAGLLGAGDAGARPRDGVCLARGACTGLAEQSRSRGPVPLPRHLGLPVRAHLPRGTCPHRSPFETEIARRGLRVRV